MHEMSVVWLRVAAVLYSLGLLHALLTVLRRKAGVFRVALVTFFTGVVLQMVAIVEEGVRIGRFPANDFYQSVTLCAFLMAVLFLVVYARHRYESLSVFMFPLVFILSLVGTLGKPVTHWSDPRIRNVWLALHVALVLVGYAALLVTAAVSVMYLIRERQLKRKKAFSTLDRLPPLGTLDDLMSKAMAVGFVFITAAVIAGSTWASIESGARWITDPRIIISLLTWGLYLVIVFARATAGVRGRKAALMVIALVGCSVVTWAAHTSLRNWLMR